MEIPFKRSNFVRLLFWLKEQKNYPGQNIDNTVATSGVADPVSVGTAKAATNAAADVAAAMLDKSPLPVSLTSFPVGPSISNERLRCTTEGVNNNRAEADGVDSGVWPTLKSS